MHIHTCRHILALTHTHTTHSPACAKTVYIHKSASCTKVRHINHVRLGLAFDIVQQNEEQRKTEAKTKTQNLKKKRRRDKGKLLCAIRIFTT